jgi:hypothetical protein
VLVEDGYATQHAIFEFRYKPSRGAQKFSESAGPVGAGGDKRVEGAARSYEANSAPAVDDGEPHDVVEH